MKGSAKIGSVVEQEACPKQHTIGLQRSVADKGNCVHKDLHPHLLAMHVCMRLASHHMASCCALTWQSNAS